MTPDLLALDGIRVIDLSRVIAGPWCGALLSDLGADVVKVEDTGSGDESRTWPPHKDGEAAAYLLFNRNKRGMALDLKAPEGVEVVTALVRDADVLIENFRTGTMESFGLGYDALAKINPRLIYCSVSAFGRTGPRKDSPGYEALMQAFSGIMSITGEPDGQPVRAGVSFLDLSTGILCALGVCSALIQRAKTGLGQRVDGSLLETAVSLLAFHAEGYLLTGAVPKALGSGHPSLSPYRNFKCRDGQWIFVAAANDRFWGKLVRVLGLDELAADPKFAVNQQRVKNRVELETLLEQVIGDPEISGSHEAAPDGFLMAYGASVVRAKQLRRASIVDVLPTILYFLGLPVARDMDGYARPDVFVPSFTEERPITFIPTYDK